MHIHKKWWIFTTITTWQSTTTILSHHAGQRNTTARTVWAGVAPSALLFCRPCCCCCSSTPLITQSIKKATVQNPCTVLLAVHNIFQQQMYIFPIGGTHSPSSFSSTHSSDYCCYSAQHTGSGPALTPFIHSFISFAHPSLDHHSPSPSKKNQKNNQPQPQPPLANAAGHRPPTTPSPRLTRRELFLPLHIHIYTYTPPPPLSLSSYTHIPATTSFHFN